MSRPTLLRVLSLLGLAAGVAPAVAQVRYLPIQPLEDRREVIFAFVPAPDPMTARELGAWQMLGEGMLYGTQDFIREQLFQFAGQAGVAPEVTWTRDALRIQLVSPEGGESTIARMLQSMILSPELSEERQTELRKRLETLQVDDWSATLMGERGDFQFAPEFLRRFHARAFRPEVLTLAATPKALAALQGRFADWQPPRIPADTRLTAFGRWRAFESARVHRWEGRPRLPIVGEVDTFAAMVALGAGKTGLLHQVMRDRHAWSYRQEAFLRPSPRGWIPTLMWASADQLPDPAEVRKELLAEVEAWDAADLERIRALARMSLEGRNPLSPFWISSRGPYRATPIERAAWEANGRWLAIDPLTPIALGNDLRRVTLPEVKDAARRLIEEMR